MILLKGMSVLFPEPNSNDIQGELQQNKADSVCLLHMIQPLEEPVGPLTMKKHIEIFIYLK